MSRFGLYVVENQKLIIKPKNDAKHTLFVGKMMQVRVRQLYYVIGISWEVLIGRALERSFLSTTEYTENHEPIIKHKRCETYYSHGEDVGSARAATLLCNRDKL
jgi:hypothetical protein